MDPNPTPNHNEHSDSQDDPAVSSSLSSLDLILAELTASWNSEIGDDTALLPVVGDTIGPYQLIADLGRGAFAKVFLAKQTNLDDRLVVLKLSTKITQEPKLLARASHPNIVEVLTATMVDGDSFQLICMPFRGGATLSALLHERRTEGTKPTNGAGLLADIDRIQPKGYPAATSTRPAREIISKLSYPRTIGWIVARLAEGLHHAYSRGVVHGDVKPSNILITADGNPMLLDFNLSVGWKIDAFSISPHGENFAEDPGGTLAYMAPERLNAVANAGKGLDELVEHPKAADRHRADIYSLGVVLLEALTGIPPNHPSDRNPRSIPQALFNEAASGRLDGGLRIRLTNGASLPADLKAILRRCLDADSTKRYQTASELAEDLDRWLHHRPLRYARSAKGLPAVTRWARQHRFRILIVSVAIVAVISSTIVSFKIAYEKSAVQRRLADERSAIEYYGEIVNSRTSGVFRLRRPGGQGVRDEKNPADVAQEYLERYGVIHDGNWRSLAKFRNLPTDQREELEALLLEESLRYSNALRKRSELPEDWRQAFSLMKRLAEEAPYSAILAETKAIGVKTGLYHGAASNNRTQARVARPFWINVYLEGVASELQGDDEEALRRYQEVQKQRPNSFWANYRAAAVAFVLKESDPKAARIASECLRRCVVQYPGNAILRHQYAGCLYAEKRYPEALKQYERALELHINNPETYLARAFLRLRLHQIQSFIDDIKIYESMIARRAPDHDPDLQNILDGDENLDRSLRSGRRFTANDPDESMARTAFAEQLWRDGHYKEALEQFERALALNPASVRIRHGLAIQLRNLSNDGKEPSFAERAEIEFATLAKDPKFEAFTKRYQPDGVYIYVRHASFLVRQGKASEAIEVARRGVRIADEVKVRQPDMHFILAAALTLDAKTHPEQTQPAFEELSKAYRLAPDRVPTWIENEPLLRGDPYRLPR